MEISSQHKKFIVARFKTIRTIDDLLILLNETKELMYGKEYSPIRKKSLNYYANPKLCKNRYRKFEIKKKSGGVRLINSPHNGLKSILKVLNVIFQQVYETKPMVVGFAPNKSIVDGAKVHVGKNYVFNIDLKDFFHSFDQKRLKYALMKAPFDLRGEHREKIAYFISCLCTHPFTVNGEIINVLPQGSPTSPFITNFLCEKLDVRLTGLAKRFGCNYSRYADDISFSNNKNVFTDIEFQTELKRIIEENQKLKLNDKKTRLLSKVGKVRQEVTGLTVNEKVNVRRSYTKQIRMLLYYWETYGIEKAQNIYSLHSSINKSRSKGISTDLKNVISGKLLYLKMVKGNDDPTFLTLKLRFDELTGNKKELKSEVKIQNETIETKTAVKEKPFIQHDPIRLVELLKEFGSDQEDIKFTTHIWDGSEIISFQHFSEKIYSRLHDFKSMNELDNNLWMKKIFPFIFQDKLASKKIPFSWGKDKITIGWNYPDYIRIWCADNYDGKGSRAIQPFNIVLPENFLPESKVINRVTIKTFMDLVNIFKKEIEFRGNDFYIAILYLISSHLIGFEIDKTDLKTLKSFSVYTNTEKILKAISRIFSIINGIECDKQQDCDQACKLIRIRSKFHDDEGGKFYTLEIIHVNSVCDKPHNHPKLSGKTGDLANVVKDLKGRCDFSILGEFSNGNKRVFAKLDYLYSRCDFQNFEVKITTNVDDPGGFVYWFKFYV
jgi:RNA-directed DNA polymerase